MQAKPFIAITTLVFTLVALAHAFRLYSQWTLQVGPYVIPMYVSWFGVAIAALMAIWGIALLRR